MSASGDEVYTVAKDGGVFVWEWLADEDKISISPSFSDGEATRCTCKK